MEAMIEAIRIAVSTGATAEQKAAGVQSCRTILAALEAETGKAIVLAGAPTPGPLAGISSDQALDLLIARLSAIVPKEISATTAPPTARTAPLRIAFVQPPTRPISALRRKP